MWRLNTSLTLLTVSGLSEPRSADSIDGGHDFGIGSKSTPNHWISVYDKLTGRHLMVRGIVTARCNWKSCSRGGYVSHKLILMVIGCRSVLYEEFTTGWWTNKWSHSSPQIYPIHHNSQTICVQSERSDAYAQSPHSRTCFRQLPFGAQISLCRNLWNREI